MFRVTLCVRSTESLGPRERGPSRPGVNRAACVANASEASRVVSQDRD